MRREVLISLLLVAAVVAAYWPVHSYPSVLLDDQGYVFQNPHVRHGLTCEGFAHAFAGVTVSNWHPLTMLSHMLDCQIFGSNEESAGWHHSVNLALHATNTALLFLALLRMTAAVWPSALVAALFGLHPLHVESVAWIAERKDVLSTFFFMLILLAYHLYAKRPTLLRYILVFVLLVLGLMSKPMLVTVPFVLLLLDYWPLGRFPDAVAVSDCPPRTARALVMEKIPLFVLVAISAAITYVVQRQTGAMGMLGPPVPFWARLGNAIFAYGQYLEKTFWPSPLAAIYPYVNRRLIDVLIVGIALAAISVASFRLARIRPFLLVGWCWYLGTLAPVIGLVQVGMQAMADRYTYIPLIGIFIIIAWGMAEFTADWPAWGKALAAALTLTTCACLTRQQVATWSSSEALYRHAVDAVPFNLFAEHGLGTVCWKEGKLEEAQRQFEAALDTKSDATTQIHGGREPLHRDLGLLLAVRNQPKQALEQLDEAMKARPQQPEPPRHAAWILATSLSDGVRNGTKAVELATQALELSSPSQPPEYWDTLAAAQAEIGKFKEAVASERRALERAKSQQAEDLIPGIERRLELFKSGIPFHTKAERPARF